MFVGESSYLKKKKGGGGLVVGCSFKHIIPSKLLKGGGKEKEIR